MNWQDIYSFGKNGWFNYQGLYDIILNKFPEGKLVEIGVWQGMSLSYLMLNCTKNNQVYGIDTFLGDPDNPNEQRIIREGKLNLLELTTQNMKSLNLSPNLIIKNSVEAAQDFEDNSCAFVFVDGGHGYDQVINDIKAWLPKIKSNGVIAGHDFDSSGVSLAVNKLFNKFEIMGDCWIYNLGDNGE